MKTTTFQCFGLSLLFLLILSSCKKERMTDMKKGKYEMINIRTFADGQKDTIHCMVYGPRKLKYHYYFSPEIENKVIDEIDVNVSRRRMLGHLKRVEFVSVRFYSGNFPLPGYFGGSAESYDIQKSQLVINYKSTTTNYSTLQQETVFTAVVQFNWLEP